MNAQYKLFFFIVSHYTCITSNFNFVFSRQSTRMWLVQHRASISVLTQTLNQSPVTPRPQGQVQGQGQQTAVQEQRQTNTTIDQDMARCILLATQSVDAQSNT